MRWVSVRVLPVPGPATISSGPPGADAATRCIASSRSSRPVPTSSIPASIGSNGSCGEAGGAIGGGGRGPAVASASAAASGAALRRAVAGLRRAGCRWPARGTSNSVVLRCAGPQLARVEEPDHAVLAVVARASGAPRRARSRRDRLAEQLAADPARRRRAAPSRRMSSSGPSAATSAVELRRRPSWTSAPTPWISPRISAAGSGASTLGRRPRRP